MEKNIMGNQTRLPGGGVEGAEAAQGANYEEPDL